MKDNSEKIKSKFKGLRFNTWLILSVFAGGILVVLWFLQLNLLPPYYRAAKIGSVRSIADNVEMMIKSDQPLSSMYQVARDNSLCLQLIDSYENTSNFNGIGSGCYIDTTLRSNKGNFDYDDMVKNIRESENLEHNYLIDYGSEMIVYGRVIDAHLGRYILLINAPVTPEKAGMVLIQNQFIVLTIIVLGFAAIVSFIISKKISEPFIMMTESAKKLAKRDFDVKFDTTGIDFNEFKDLAETLNYATDELKKVDELRLDLIANVSHDIKTPLTMIMAYTEMIQDFSKDDQKLLLQHLDVISTEANYLDNLVENMLELSMLQSGSITLEEEKFNLNNLVEEMISLFKHKEVVINYNFEQTFNVKADRVKIGQVIYNFINNAIKYSKDKPIEIKLSKNNNNVRVSVIDFGVGIDKKNLAYVWDRYYRIDKNFARDQEGQGLGLSIARGILIAHNANFGINSELDKGSEFYFDLKII